MGQMNHLLVSYCEITGTSQEEAARVPLAEMQQVVDSKGAHVPVLKAALSDSGQWSTVLVQHPIGMGKADFTPPIPWVKIGTYVKVALQTVGLQDYTIAVVSNGLHVCWRHWLIQINALHSMVESNLNPPQTPLFQLKLIHTQLDADRVGAVEYKREYADIACVCAAWFNETLIKHALHDMEAEWAAESAAADADAVLMERGEALAEVQAQLGDEETADWL